MSAARDQLHYDIYTTAMEGGINYWANTHSYHLSNNDVEDTFGFFAEIDDAEGDGAVHRIDVGVIRKGYRLAATTQRDKIRWSSEPPPLVYDGEDNDWDYDAGDADVIVQLGLFGEVVYG